MTEESTRSKKREGLWLTELKAERMREGLTQKELVEMAGVSRGTLVRIETGKRAAQSKTARKLAEALGVSIRRLAGEEEFIVPEPPADEGLPEPGAPQAPREAIEGEYLTVFVGDRSEDEVLTEVRRWYRLIRAARANTEASTWGGQPEPEDLGTE